MAAHGDRFCCCRWEYIESMYWLETSKTSILATKERRIADFGIASEDARRRNVQLGAC